MRTDRNRAGLRELTGPETEEVAGGATTATFAAATPSAYQQYSYSSVYFPRSMWGSVPVPPSCW